MTSIKALNKHFYDNRYFYLLACTTLQIFLVSFFPGRVNTLLNELTFSLFILANLNFVRRKKRFLAVMAIFAVILIILIWIPETSVMGFQSVVAQNITVILFISIIIYLIIAQIIESKIVSVNMILGVITIYVLFGLMAGECNQLVYNFDHQAFTGNLDPNDLSDLRYYSYVTMTTLGYGDIVPVSQIARAVSVFFSLAGQIYLAVVIALIVGKYVSHSDKKEM
jgi:hypothetical protein